MDINSKAMGAVLCILLVTSVFSGAAGKTKETDMTLLRTTASLSGADSALLQDCPPCMVSYWRLDDSSGTTVSDSYGGNSGEIQSNGNASDPQWTTGKVGNALYFAGDPSDSVEIDD
ncbi:MAG: hypothetical protein HXS54_10000, partial [Theionarchaea archaeon]|nr:hypothetical protein [Theionarchaea archaeon]